MDYNDEEEIRLTEMEEAMELYNKIADIFVERKTTLKLSYTVLSSMADTLYAFMLSQTEEDE